MKRHLIFLLVLLHLFTAPLVAQPLTGGTARKAAGIAPGEHPGEPGATVEGRVVDRAGEPVPGVAVVMLDRDSLYVAAAASGADGRFRIDSRVRPYRLLFQHLAYEVRTLEGAADRVGDIALNDAATAIEGVVVSVERPVVRVEEGKLSYDLGAATKGMAVNNAYEAIERLPGVSTQDGRLTLAGAGGVTVILNGKPTTMSADQLESLLRSTPVERVERAEVMYSAPPQYHVRGAAINLVLRHGGERSFSGQLHGQYANNCFGSWEGAATWSTPRPSGRPTSTTREAPSTTAATSSCARSTTSRASGTTSPSRNASHRRPRTISCAPRSTGPRRSRAA